MNSNRLPDPSFRARLFIFSRRDIEDYWDLLTEAFPTLRAFDEPNGLETASWQAAPPELRFLDRASLPDVEHAHLLFDPDWVPGWWRTDSGNWMYRASRPNGEMYVGGKLSTKPGRPPSISDGQIYIRSEKGNKDHERISRKVVRLIQKIAINRFQQLKYPSYEIVATIHGKGDTWIGRDAARWARESPDRLLGYDWGIKCGLRPLD